jgi:hypothetical protein
VQVVSVSVPLEGVPWDPWPEGWRLGQPGNCLAFDTTGLHVRSQDGTQDVPWADVMGLTISFGRHSAGRDLWEVISPKPTPDLALSGTVAVDVQLRLRDLNLAVPMTRACSWRVAFVVEEVLQTLKAERLRLIGQPGLVDGAVREVVPQIRPHTRLVMNTDLLGLDRLLGGHGAYRGAIEEAVARHS